ncbi:MAG: FtsW/RodA/SpoVE family cell cycle protein [Chloroflexi bacterium]|nr:FtsW/RodA/SpoVE family cell cycle protein [Chloroflexota bacterium]
MSDRASWGWRWRELLLLGFPCAMLLLGWLSIDLARTGAPDPALWTRWLVFVGLVLGTHGWLAWRYPSADQGLLPIGAALTALSLVVVERLVPALADRQLAWLALALGAMVLALSLLPSIRWLHPWQYTWALAGLGLVGLTFVAGVDPNGSGARLWLGFGDALFQPSEALKLLLVLFFASYLDDKRELLAWGGPRWGRLRTPPLPYLAPLLVMLALCLGVVILQRDLGAALLYFCLFLALLYVASGRASYVALGLGGLLLGGALMERLFDHVRVRVAMWLDPWSDAAGRGYQVIQALVAFASGGVLGSGLTYGYPGYIPAVHTDFVIAAIGEELGLIGSLGTVALYMLWLHRGLAIALTRRSSFSTLLAVGLTSAISLQALVILGGTLRLIPLTGITLPFVSYGGSSLLVNFLMLGLLLAVSAERPVDRHG